MANLSEFGKTLRKLRIDREIMLKTMADEIGVTSAYLSAVETGKKPTNPSLINKISNYLQLDEEKSWELTEAASKSKNDITVKPINDYQAELALMFARKMENDSIDLQAFENFLRNETKGD